MQKAAAAAQYLFAAALVNSVFVRLEGNVHVGGERPASARPLRLTPPVALKPQPSLSARVGWWMIHAGDGVSDGQKSSVLISSEERASFRTGSVSQMPPGGTGEILHRALLALPTRLSSCPFCRMKCDRQIDTRATFLPPLNHRCIGTPLPRPTQLFPKRIPTFPQAVVAVLFSLMLE